MSSNPDPIEVEKILRKLGWKGEADAPVDSVEDAEQDEDPLAALDINTHEEVQRLALPQDTLEGIAPPQKERVRNIAGGVPDPEGKPPPDPWSRDVPQLGNVSVTPGELEHYTKCLLFDERFELPVNLWVGGQHVQVGVRSLYMGEREVIMLAVADVVKNYPIQTVHSASIVSDYTMKLHVLTQLTRFGEAALQPYDANPGIGTRPEDSPKVAELAQLARTHFSQTHQAKLMAMIRAVHLFETKQQILEDCFHNRDFPRPAGAY